MNNRISLLFILANLFVSLGCRNEEVVNNRSIKGQAKQTSAADGSAVDQKRVSSGGIAQDGADEFIGGDGDLAPPEDLGGKPPDEAGTDAIDQPIDSKLPDENVDIKVDNVTEESFVLDLRPEKTTIVKGEKVVVALMLKIENGEVDVSAEAEWASSDPSVVTVLKDPLNDKRILVTGLAPGKVTIDANWNSHGQSFALEVKDSVLESLEIAGGDKSFIKDQTFRMTLVGVFSGDRKQDLTGKASWVIENPSVVSILQPPNTFIARAKGQSTISVSIDGISVSTLIKVDEAQLNSIVIEPKVVTLAVGSVKNFTVSGFYSNKTKKDLTNLASWLVKDEQILRSKGEGQIEAIALGQTTVEAEVQGFLAIAKVTVGDGFKELSIDDQLLEAPLGHEIGLRVFAKYDDGHAIDISKEVVVSADSSRISINSQDNEVPTVKAINVGSADINVVFGNHKRVFKFKVQSAILEKIEIPALSNDVVVGDEAVELHAIGTFSDGRTLDVTRDVIWRSSDISVASIRNMHNYEGHLRAYREGSIEVSASGSGVQGVRSVKVMTSASKPSISLTVEGEATNLSSPMHTRLMIDFQADHVKSCILSQVDTAGEKVLSTEIHGSLPLELTLATTNIKLVCQADGTPAELTKEIEVSATTPSVTLLVNDVDADSISLTVGQTISTKLRLSHLEASQCQLSFDGDSTIPSVALESGKLNVKCTDLGGNIAEDQFNIEVSELN